MRRDLTDVFLRNLKPPQRGRSEIRDSKVRGLVLRMTPTGAATWSVRALLRDGRHTRVNLGTYPALSLAEARKVALAALARIHQGSDLVAEKRTARAARKAALAEASVAERLTQWQQTKASRWSDRYAAEVKRLVEREIVPALGTKPLRMTTREDWTALVARKRASAPVVAGHLYRVASSFLHHAEAEGWIDSPILPRKGAARLAPPPPPRERALSDDELIAVWIASATEPPKSRAFVRLLILTGCRRAEAAGITTGEVDRAAGLWRLPGTRTKNRRPHLMPLCELALAELDAVWPEHAEEAGDDWRLLGAHGSAFVGFSKLKARIDAKATLAAPWCWHDLRRTCRSGMARLGIDRLHAARALNHVSAQSRLERTYDTHDYEAEVIAALRRWQAHVASLVMPAPGAAIVPLRRSRT
jgi:integrase